MKLKLINLSIVALVLSGCDVISSGSEGIIAAENECLNNGESAKEQCVCVSAILEEKLTEEGKRFFTASKQIEHENLKNKPKNDSEKMDRIERKAKEMNVPIDTFFSKTMSAHLIHIDAKKACQ